MSDSLRGRRALVTGGRGFLGRHVCRALRARGIAEIFAPGSAEVDLRDPAATIRLFQAARPDIVFHLAARVGGIGANRLHPGTFFRDNMAMGLQVLEAARTTGAPKVVIAGTVCAYPKHAPVPFLEAGLWDGYPEETNAAYGVAKRALLVMAQSYRQEFGCNFVTLLPANLYGPEDNFDLETSHVIPAMIRKFVEAARDSHPSVVLWGDGTPTREFLFVEDAAEAFCIAAERYDEPAPVNVGTGEEISTRALAETIARLTSFSGALTWDTTRPTGQPRRSLDVTRARETLAFTARTSLTEGLARTIAWYRASQDGSAPGPSPQR